VNQEESEQTKVDETKNADSTGKYVMHIQKSGWRLVMRITQMVYDIPRTHR